MIFTPTRPGDLPSGADIDHEVLGVDSARQAAPSRLHLLSYSEMEAMPEPEWLVEGVIQKRSATLIFGKSNSFKTFIGVDIGLTVERGIPWHGAEVAQGGVLFVVTEGANGFGRLRIPAWYEHHDVPREARNAFLYPQEIRLDVTEDVSALIAAMRERGPFALLVLDIFGGTMTGSEVEDKTARAWVHGIQRIIRETGAATLTIAHTGWQDDSRARMHTHFWGSFDSRLRMEGDKDALTGTLAVERHKDADSSGQWGFRMVAAGASLVPELDTGVKPSKTRNLTVKQRIALAALDDALFAHGVQKQGADWPSCKVVLIEKWREAAYRHGITDSDKPDSRKKAFQLQRDALMNKGVVRIFDEHVWRSFA